jgi:DNA-binding MarR family transcriptional regulator
MTEIAGVDRTVSASDPLDADPDPPGTASDPRLATWRLMLLSFARLSRRLDEELRAEHDLSLPEYEALLRIAESPSGRLRMSQLASEVELSKSGVTRLIDRLVADGLVERSACLADARGAEAVLTEAGLQRLRTAARTHLRGVQAYFVEPLARTDLAAIERLLGRVVHACTVSDPSDLNVEGRRDD